MPDPLHADDPSRFALGVDGGGTKTEVWLARFNQEEEPTIVGRGLGGSSNPRAVGLEQALANLAAAIDASWNDSQLAPFAVEIAVLAMSGASQPAMRARIVAWAQTQGFARVVRMEHDAEPVLVEGTPTGMGIALIVGTGSAAIAADGEGNKHVVGGWGYRYGDEGSAYWIGCRALAAVARSADGRAAPTALVDALGSKLGVANPREFLGALEQTGHVRSAIASLAAEVERTARDGDAAAMRIVAEGAEELALMIETLARRIGLQAEFPLALAGGVICASQLLRTALLESLAKRSLQPKPVTVVEHPVAGCIRLAGRALFASG